MSRSRTRINPPSISRNNSNGRKTREFGNNNRLDNYILEEFDELEDSLQSLQESSIDHERENTNTNTNINNLNNSKTPKSYRKSNLISNTNDPRSQNRLSNFSINLQNRLDSYSRNRKKHSNLDEPSSEAAAKISGSGLFSIKDRVPLDRWSPSQPYSKLPSITQTRQTGKGFFRARKKRESVAVLNNKYYSMNNIPMVGVSPKIARNYHNKDMSRQKPKSFAASLIFINKDRNRRKKNFGSFVGAGGLPGAVLNRELEEENPGEDGSGETGGTPPSDFKNFSHVFRSHSESQKKKQAKSYDFMMRGLSPSNQDNSGYHKSMKTNLNFQVIRGSQTHKRVRRSETGTPNRSRLVLNKLFSRMDSSGGRKLTPSSPIHTNMQKAFNKVSRKEREYKSNFDALDLVGARKIANKSTKWIPRAKKTDKKENNIFKLVQNKFCRKSQSGNWMTFGKVNNTVVKIGATRKGHRLRRSHPESGSEGGDEEHLKLFVKMKRRLEKKSKKRVEVKRGELLSMLSIFDTSSKIKLYKMLLKAQPLNIDSGFHKLSSFEILKTFILPNTILGEEVDKDPITKIEVHLLNIVYWQKLVLVYEEIDEDVWLMKAGGRGYVNVKTVLKVLKQDAWIVFLKEAAEAKGEDAEAQRGRKGACGIHFVINYHPDYEVDKLIFNFFEVIVNDISYFFRTYHDNKTSEKEQAPLMFTEADEFFARKVKKNLLRKLRNTPFSLEHREMNKFFFKTFKEVFKKFGVYSQDGYTPIREIRKMHEMMQEQKKQKEYLYDDEP